MISTAHRPYRNSYIITGATTGKNNYTSSRSFHACLQRFSRWKEFLRPQHQSYYYLEPTSIIEEEVAPHTNACCDVCVVASSKS